MGKVVNLIDRQPHITGNALCLTCGNKWVAVAPIGTVELECSECSECHTFKGVFEGMTCPNTLYECVCGNHHFYIDPTGPMCSRCGLRHEL